VVQTVAHLRNGTYMQWDSRQIQTGRASSSLIATDNLGRHSISSVKGRFGWLDCIWSMLILWLCLEDKPSVIITLSTG